MKPTLSCKSWQDGPQHWLSRARTWQISDMHSQVWTNLLLVYLHRVQTQPSVNAGKAIRNTTKESKDWPTRVQLQVEGSGNRYQQETLGEDWWRSCVHGKRGGRLVSCTCRLVEDLYLCSALTFTPETEEDTFVRPQHLSILAWSGALTTGKDIDALESEQQRGRISLFGDYRRDRSFTEMLERWRQEELSER